MRTAHLPTIPRGIPGPISGGLGTFNVSIILVLISACNLYNFSGKNKSNKNLEVTINQNYTNQIKNQIKRNYAETQLVFEFLERFSPNVTAKC